MLSREQVNWWRHYFHTVEDMPSNERGEAIELCDLALRSLSEPAAQVVETPRTVPVWIKSLVMQVNERVAEDATTRCTLDMENASNAVRDWQAQERELAQMAKRVSELEAAIAPAIAEAERANRLGADKLRSTEINAQYWLEGGRRTANRGEAVFAVEQAMNAYSNAAYGLAEDLAKAEVKLAEKSKEVARWEKMYVCAQNSNSFRQDALDGK